MSPRSIRRAAERRVRKEQNRERQRTASSGVSERVAPSAVETGLTGRTVLLHSNDAEAYRRHILAYQTEYNPVGLRECELVQSLADTQWRLNRIPALESGIYALGHTEFEGVVEAEQIELQTYLRYEKSLRNLQLQESRLLRRYQKEMAELRTFQKERENRTLETGPEASAPSVRANHAPIGFEFSTEPKPSAPPVQTNYQPIGFEFSIEPEAFVPSASDHELPS